MMSELDKAHEAILQDKNMYLTKLTVLAGRLILAGNMEAAKTIKEAVDFFDYNLK